MKHDAEDQLTQARLLGAQGGCRTTPVVIWRPSQPLIDPAVGEAADHQAFPWPRQLGQAH